MQEWKKKIVKLLPLNIKKNTSKKRYKTKHLFSNVCVTRLKDYLLWFCVRRKRDIVFTLMYAHSWQWHKIMNWYNDCTITILHKWLFHYQLSYKEEAWSFTSFRLCKNNYLYLLQIPNLLQRTTTDLPFTIFSW